MRTSEKTDLIDKAFLEAKKKFNTLKKSGVNGFFKNEANPKGMKYSTLEDILECCESALREQMIMVHQYTHRFDKDEYESVTMFKHAESGQFYAINDPLLINKKDMQGFSAAKTYAKRIAIGSFFGLASEPDDDGNLNRQARITSPPQQKRPVAKEPSNGFLSLKQSEDLFDLAKSKGFTKEDVVATIKNLTGKEKLSEVPTVALPVIEGYFKNNSPKVLG